MFESVHDELAKCALRDRHRLRLKLQAIIKQSRNAQADKSALAAFEAEIRDSQARCELRHAARPRSINYPANLPITACIGEITTLLHENQVLVIAGDTGSGKTTQLPKACLDAGFGHYGLIGHTQPRRLAAVSVATRIAEELGCKPGSGVGYQVRFNEQTSDNTFLKLMTDGILLSEIQSDRFLNNYEVLIIDEAHERSLNIDFLLGFLRQLLQIRKDLKLIITSATIDVEKFSVHFDNAPIVTIEGRSYPVEVRYSPISVDDSEAVEESGQPLAILRAIEEIMRLESERKRTSGDILVFLSGEREIRETANFLRKHNLRDTEILPLYARLRQSEQLRIFQSHRGRRVVLATNVAETSLTVPGINYVIDTGLARIGRYSLQSKVQRLPIEPVSQASANQRKGRCGRLADGVCIRLYSEQDFNSRAAFTDPEILRTNLAAVILRMKSLRLGDAEEFPFLERPEQKAINEGSRLLMELNALTPARELTDHGRKMATIPVDPRMARMLIAANSYRCLRELLIIVAALSTQDPRENSLENKQIAMQRQADFNHPESDFLSLVNLWDAYEQQRQNLNQNSLRKYCKYHFLSFMRMQEWRELHRQLLLSCQQLGMKVNREAADYTAVHRSIITGSLNQIACLDERKTYLGNRNRKFSLFATSVLASKPPKWIVTGEQIETSSTFATMAARIDPLWVEEAAVHLVKRDYFEPHWSMKRQEVMAYEKVQLYGLVIVEKSLVRFRDIDPAASHDIFIRQALATDQIESNLPFLKHNRNFLQELARQEDKLRRPDLIVSEREIADFYASRIPARINSTQALEQWWRDSVKAQPDLLKMTYVDLLAESDWQQQLAAYPDEVPLHQNRLQIDYVFQPGEARDGATLELPLALLHQFTQADLDWAVPGTIREKCIFLIKGLPKAVRKNLIPVSGFVDSIVPLMQRKDVALVDALAQQIRNQKRIEIDGRAFADVELPNHLLVKIKVVDADGEELSFGTDLEGLRTSLMQQELACQAPGQSAASRHELEVTGVTEWNFAALPRQVRIGDDLIVVRYPGLVDEGETVGVRLFGDAQSASTSHREGLLRLCMLKSVQQRNVLRKLFSRMANSHALQLPAELKDIAEDAVLATYKAAFESANDGIRDKDAFDMVLLAGKSHLIACGEQIERLLVRILPARLSIYRQLKEFDSVQLQYLKKDIEQQLAALIYAGFVSTTELNWLKEFPRYLEAMRLRLEKVAQFGEKDKACSLVVNNYWQRYLDLSSQAKGRHNSELGDLRWMIEELRVSLFAQGLGTRVSVSPQRLDKILAKLR